MQTVLQDFRAALPVPGLLGRNPIVANAVRRFVVPDPAVDLCASALNGAGRLDWGRLLANLDLRCQIADADLARVPRTGPVVVVANHPFGMLEGIVLADLLPRIRPDIRIMANHLLAALPGAGEPFLFVNPFGGADAASMNVRALREARRWLENGGMLVVFPAGEVAHPRPGVRGIVDPEWNDGAAMLLRQTGAAALPVRFEGQNSLSFHLLGMLHPRLRTARLTAELLHKRGSRIAMRIGKPVAPERLARIGTDTERTRYLRWRTELLQAPSAPIETARAAAVIAPSVDAATLASEIAGLAPLAAHGALQVFEAGAVRIPSVLREIGRLREITFRAAGEGTGRPLDLDRFDRAYRHLFVWDTQARRIAGAYRFRSTTGTSPADLYTHTLFHYGQAFLDRLGPALELGRSFVRAEYQKQFAPLMLLWKGIGAWVTRNPEHRILFGPVSISREYTERSRALLAAALERRDLDLAKLVRPRRPFRNAEDPRIVRVAAPDLQSLSEAVAETEPDGKGLPILLKQYLKLGGNVVGFNVDPEFSGVLDGLIVVDLTHLDRQTLARYFG